MKIAILSAGPSLRQTFNPDEHFDLRIAVNSAASAHHCDWWACGDAQTFDRVEAIGYPVLFTMTESDSHFRNRSSTAERLKQHRMVLWSEMGLRLRPPQCWSDWSITAALALAVDQGGRQVHVYGHDMAGTIDINGHRLEKRAENWKRVAAAWDEMTRWASAQGVRVKMHQPQLEAAR